MVPDDIQDRIRGGARAAYAACTLCERRCGANRLASTPDPNSYCGLGAGAHIFNELLHFGEEHGHPVARRLPTGCNFRCVFCMTGNDIVPEGLRKGVPLDPAAFGRLHARRRAEGATNLNFLGGEPSVNLLAILEALARCPRDTTVVWNSNMYFSEEQADLLRGVVDVFLADWKYGNDACALKLSAAPRYLEIIRRNLAFARSCARVIVRYLVMPGHNDCCLRPSRA